MYDGDYQLRKDVDNLQRLVDSIEVTGGTGESYQLVPNTTMVYYKDNAYTPSNLSFTSYKIGENGSEFFDGVLEIYSSDDEENWSFEKRVEGHTISINPSSSIKFYRCYFKIDGVVYSSQTIPVFSSDDDESFVVSFNTESIVIPCDENGYTLKDEFYYFRYKTYYGGKLTNPTIQILGLPNRTAVTNETHSEEYSSFVFSVPRGLNLSYENTGFFTVAFTHFNGQYQGSNPPLKFIYWSKVKSIKGDKGDTGAKGDKGDDGVGISSITEKYAISSNDTTPPTNWQNTPPSMTREKPFLWNYEIINYTDNTTETTNKRVIGSLGKDGSDGDDGNDGKGIQSITNYYLASAQNTGITKSTNGWTTTPQSTNNTIKYLWNYEIITYTDNTSIETIPCIIGTYGDKGDTGAKGDKGDDGVGISSIVEYYAISSSNSTPPTNWSNSPQSMTEAKPYLWNYEKINYTNNTSFETERRVIGSLGKDGSDGDDGNDGKGIKSISNKYLVSSQNTGITTSSNGWTTSPQSMSQSNKYLWNYEIITYTDNSTTTTTPCIIGTYGDKGDTGAKGDKGDTGAKGDKGDDGVGIDIIEEFYGLSNSSSIPPTNWESSPLIPNENNKYLWNYETIYYTDGIPQDTDARIIGMYSSNGEDGNDGKGIKSITNKYLVSTQNTGITTSSSGWSNTPQTMTESNKYLWNYEIITYTDNSTTTTNPCVIGVYGNKGNTGAKGDKGDDGAKGDDGDGIQYIYARTETDNISFTPISDDSELTYFPKPTNQTTINEGEDGENSVLTWWEKPQGVNGICKYEWVSQRTQVNGVWGEWTIPSVWAVFSQDGEDGLIGDKGEKGDKGEDGAGLDDETLANINKITNGDIDASTLGGLTPDNFLSAEYKEWHITNFMGTGSSLTVYKLGRICVLNLLSCNGTLTSIDGSWRDVNPNNLIPSEFCPPDLIYVHNGLFNGMAIQKNGLIKLKFKDGDSGLTRGVNTSTKKFNYVSGSAIYFVDETSYPSSLTVTSPSTSSSFSITTSDFIEFTLKDSNNNPIPNQTIKVAITKQGTSSTNTYNLSTDELGKVKFTLNLFDGTYSVVGVFSAKGYATQTCTRTITVNKANVSIIKNWNSTSKTGTFTLYNNDNNLIPFQSANVTLQIDGVNVKSVNTGSTGVVPFDLSSYQSGSHTAKVVVGADRRVNSTVSSSHTYDTGIPDPTIYTITQVPTAIDASINHTTYCSGWSGVKVATLKSNDSSAMKSSVATAVGTYKTPKAVAVAMPLSIPSTATVKELTVNVWNGHFGATSTNNAGGFNGWTVELWTGSPTGSGTKIATTKTTTKLDKSNWNKWVKSSLTWSSSQLSNMVGHYNTLYVKLLPTPNTQSNPCTVGLDMVQVQAKYIN